MSKIKVKDIDVTISTDNGEDYINLTEIVKTESNGDQLLQKWLSTKNTIEYLGVWETFRNAENFNLPEFGVI